MYVHGYLYWGRIVTCTYVYGHVFRVHIFYTWWYSSVQSAAGARCCPLSRQPQHSPPTVDQTHLFRYHPILHDVDIPSLIEKDPILNAVESPVEEEVPLPATSTHQ